jgi:hypothetical protein
VTATTTNERRTTASVEISHCRGTVEFTDAKQNEQSGVVDVNEILNIDYDDLGLAVSVEPDQDGILLRLNGYHMEVDGSDKFFRAHMGVVLTATDIRRLHEFLGFLCSSGLDGVAND